MKVRIQLCRKCQMRVVTSFCTHHFRKCWDDATFQPATNRPNAGEGFSFKSKLFTEARSWQDIGLPGTLKFRNQPECISDNHWIQISLFQCFAGESGECTGLADNPSLDDSISAEDLNLPWGETLLFPLFTESPDFGSESVLDSGHALAFAHPIN